MWVRSTVAPSRPTAAHRCCARRILAIGLTDKVARCFRVVRNPAFVVHQLATLVAQRIHGIALGYEDLNDHDDLRCDPALGLLSDTLEPKRDDVETLAGKSTPNRLRARCYCYLPLHIFCGRHLLVAKLRRANIDASLTDAVRRGSKPTAQRANV